MALVIEICLVRVFVSSWAWAVVVVVLYCIFVYIRQVLLIKKQNKNKSGIESENTFEGTLIQDSTNGNRKSRKQLYNMYPTISVAQKN